MEAFATIVDLRRAWPDMPQDREADAAEYLLDASAYISTRMSRAHVPILADTEADYEDQHRVLATVTCALALRLMPRDSMGDNGLGAQVQMETVTAGVFSQTRQYMTTDGKYYLTKAEKDALGIRGPRVSTVRVGMLDREARHAQ